MRRAPAHLTAVLAAGLLLACGGAAETPAPAAPARAALKKVTLNLNPALSYGPLMIARDEGFFAQEGIEAEFVALDSNSAVVAASSGKLDVLSVGLRAGIFNVMRKGVPMAVVADRGHAAQGGCVAEAIVAPVATAKRMQGRGGNPRGERIGLLRGGVAEMLMTRLLARHELTDADVVMVQLPQGSSAGASHEKIDAIRYVVEPNLSAAIEDGWAQVVAVPHELLPEHQVSVLVYGKRLLQDDPQLGHRFMRAYLRGVRRFKEGKTDRNVAILSRYTKLSPEIIRRACWVSIAADGRVDPRRVQPFLDWALERRYLDGPVTTAMWSNPSYAAAANDALSARGQ